MSSDFLMMKICVKISFIDELSSLLTREVFYGISLGGEVLSSKSIASYFEI